MATRLLRTEFPGQQNQDFRWIAPKLHARQCRRSLDAGCGRGLYLRELVRASGYATGIDASLESVRAAAGTASSSLAVGLLQHLPYRDGAFDRVVSVEVLTHIRPAGQGPAVRELFRILEPGGSLLLTAHGARRHRLHLIKRWLRPSASHPGGLAIYPVDARTLIQTLQFTGFEIVQGARYLNFFNAFSIETARDRPSAAARLVRCEDMLARVPIVRSLGVTFLVEARKPGSA